MAEAVLKLATFELLTQNTLNLTYSSLSINDNNNTNDTCSDNIINANIVSDTNNPHFFAYKNKQIQISQIPSQQIKPPTMYPPVQIITINTMKTIWIKIQIAKKKEMTNW